MKENMSYFVTLHTKTKWEWIGVTYSGQLSEIAVKRIFSDVGPLENRWKTEWL